MSVRSDDCSEYAFGPAVRLRVRGSRRAAAHFALEFGPRLEPMPDPQVDLDVEWRAAGRGAGGYKTARWHVELSHPEDRPLRATIRLSGPPPSFALSLAQGWFVEPLVAVALAREGYVALPSAGLVLDDGALVLMGPSGSGKSSLSVRALALGHSPLGDDQVLTREDGGCLPYPRRLRIYPDIRETAPEAWLRLRRSTRRTLAVRRAVRRLTRGFVAPSLAVPASEIAPQTPPGVLPLKRLLVVERDAGSSEVEVERRDAAWAVDRAGTILADQRGRLLAIADERWRHALSAVAERELEILRSAMDAASVEHVRLPTGWEASRAVTALARQAGL